MIKARLFFCVVMVNSIAAKAQLIPAVIQKLPLKQNQIAKRWVEGIRNGYCINTYLDDGVMSECTIDSLAADILIVLQFVFSTRIKLAAILLQNRNIL